ncbi:hypothetical protein RR21198_1173 [Rhodococcus rhodochrous ATCC 21198]|nr:hypothetical protein RR21198_1173 [Rhodococcus rhodochrous ATCC 21198]
MLIFEVAAVTTDSGDVAMAGALGDVARCGRRDGRGRRRPNLRPAAIRTTRQAEQDQEGQAGGSASKVPGSGLP